MGHYDGSKTRVTDATILPREENRKTIHDYNNATEKNSDEKT